MQVGIAHMADEHKNIRIHRETWEELHYLKEPGDTFDDVIQRLIEQSEEGEEGNVKQAVMAD
jgi:predicted CopG family antitoxin